MLSRRLLRVAFVAMVALAFIGLASAQEGSDLSLDMEDMSMEEETNFLELDTLAEPATHALVEAEAKTVAATTTERRHHHHRWHWHRPHHHHHHRPHHHHHHRHHGHHHHRHHGHHHHHRHHGHRWWRWGWGHRRHGHHHHRHHGHHHHRHHHHGHHRHHWRHHGHHHGHHGHHRHHGHRHHHHGGHHSQPAAAQHSSQPAAQQSHQSQPAAQQSQQSQQQSHSSSGSSSQQSSGSSSSSGSSGSSSSSSSHHHEEHKESKPQRPAFDPASRHSSGRIDLSPTGYKNSYITDWGYAHDRQWVDVREAGVRNDYGRWVGNHPSVWFSIALYDCPNQYSGRGEWILENGAVKRGPNYKGHECKQRPAVTRTWNPAPSAPFRAPPAKQTYYADLKSATARAAHSEVAKLSCPDGQKINVKDATFGAGAGVYQASGFIVKGSCHFAGSHQHAVDVCNNKAHCEVKPTDAEFGSDPCPSNGNKEVTIVYSCVTFTAPTTATTPAAIQTNYAGIKLALFNQDQEAFLSCPGSKQLNILDAAFGQKQGFYESNGFIVKGKCNAANSAKVVSANCHGKSDCKFQVDASKLPTGDDCNSTPKTLKITYRCANAEESKPFATVSFPAPRQWAYKKAAPLAVTPQPKDAAAASVSGGGNGVVKIGNSEVHIHVTQLSAPEPNAKALNYVEEKLDRLHETAMNKIDGLLDDIETRRKAKKPCLKKLQRTINKFKRAFVSESANIERITHKYSYADDAPTLV